MHISSSKACELRLHHCTIALHAHHYISVRPSNGQPNFFIFILKVTSPQSPAAKQPAVKKCQLTPTAGRAQKGAASKDKRRTSISPRTQPPYEAGRRATLRFQHGGFSQRQLLSQSWHIPWPHALSRTTTASMDWTR